MKKRGQAWGIDLTIATVIFFAAMVIFYLYSINYPTEGQEKIDNLFFEGNFIADILLSNGLPEGWNESNVVSLGILTENKINETKLNRTYSLANFNSNPAGYDKTKALFNTKYDYFFNFSEQITVNSEPIPEGGIGKQISQNPENIVKITRLTIYRGKPVTLNVYVWEQ